MSAPEHPNASSAEVNIRSKCVHWLTSVLWNIALPAVPSFGRRCIATTSFASGRRAKSAKSTLHPRDKRRFAKQKFIPKLHLEYIGGTFG